MLTTFRLLASVDNQSAAKRILVAAFVNAVGTGAFISTVTIYFTRVHGFDAATVGLGLSAGAAVALLATVPGALLSERLGARRALVITNVLRAVGYGAFALVNEVWVFVLLTMLLTALDRAAPPMMQTLIIRLFPKEQRGAVMGVRQACLITGLSVGAGMTALALLAETNFWLGALIVLNAGSYLAAAALIAGLPDDSPTRSTVSRAMGWNFWPGARFASLTVAAGMLGIVDSLVTVAVPVWVVRETNAPAVFGGLVIVAYTAAAALSQGPLGRYMRSSDDVAKVVGLGSACVASGAIALMTASVVSALPCTMLLCAGGVLLALGGGGQSLGLWLTATDAAPAERHERYLAVFALSGTLQRTIGPGLGLWVLTTWPTAGWAAVGALLLAFGLGARRLVATVGANETADVS